MQADEVKQASGRLQQSSPFLYLRQRNCHRKQVRLVHGEREYEVSLTTSAHKAPAHVPLVLPDVSVSKQRCPYGQRRCSDLHRTFPSPSLPSYWGIVPAGGRNKAKVSDHSWPTCYPESHSRHPACTPATGCPRHPALEQVALSAGSSRVLSLGTTCTKQELVRTLLKFKVRGATNSIAPLETTKFWSNPNSFVLPPAFDSRSSKTAG